MWMTMFIISALINLLAVFYVRWLLTTIKVISEDLESISSKIMDYVEHVASLHELEMFYGEPTLQRLMDHGRQLVSDLEGIDLIMNEEDKEEEFEEEETS